MIFCSKNSKGLPAWQLILDGKKTVTRRIKPCVVGKDYAVCPGRGKFQVCRIKVLSCITHKNWLEHIKIEEDFEQDAKKEGFASTLELYNWFYDHKINIGNTYRIEFEVVK